MFYRRVISFCRWENAILGDVASSILSIPSRQLRRTLERSATTASFSLSSQFNLIDKVHSKIIIIIIQSCCSSEKHAVHRRRQEGKCLGAKLIQFWVPADAWLLHEEAVTSVQINEEQARTHNRDLDCLIESYLITQMLPWNVYEENIRGTVVISKKNDRVAAIIILMSGCRGSQLSRN